MNQISRRAVLRGLGAGLPLATVLANPLLARAEAEALETVELTTAGGKKVTGALALPKKARAPAVLVIHEWWGLNDQIKSMAAALALEGYVALACDLYDGKVADNRDDARAYMSAVDPKVASDTVVTWVNWLKRHKRASGKIGTIGWCFGGSWSLNTSLAVPVDATVVYYGSVAQKAEDLKRLKGPVLGHFATLDKWINQKMVADFEAEMDKAGRDYTSHWYEADHAFANPTQARYDEADAKLAWERTLAFFKKTL